MLQEMQILINLGIFWDFLLPSASSHRSQFISYFAFSNYFSCHEQKDEEAGF